MKRISFLLLIIPLLLAGCGSLGFGSFEGKPTQTTTAEQKILTHNYLNKLIQ